MGQKTLHIRRVTSVDVMHVFRRGSDKRGDEFFYIGIRDRVVIDNGFPVDIAEQVEDRGNQACAVLAVRTMEKHCFALFFEDRPKDLREICL